MNEIDKYSLWMPPAGEEGANLQALVDKLAEENQAPQFVPHVTLIGNLLNGEYELDEAKGMVEQLSQRIGRFTLSLSEYGYKDEERRSLYLLANSPALDSVFGQTNGFFPQVSSEHFRGLPHMSVLYGDYPPGLKRQIIRGNPIPTAQCPVESFDIYSTAGPISEWQLEQSFQLRHTNST